MSKTLTGASLIQLFSDYCEKSHKLFIPDKPRQEEIAESLVRHYDHDLLEKGVQWYINNNAGPFLLFEFAVESRSVIEKVKYESASKVRFQDIVEETRKRMENS